MNCQCKDVDELWENDALRYTEQHLRLAQKSPSGWQRVYQCPETQHRWVLDWPHSERQGGGQARLRRMDKVKLGCRCLEIKELKNEEASAYYEHLIEKIECLGDARFLWQYELECPATGCQWVIELERPSEHPKNLLDRPKEYLKGRLGGLGMGRAPDEKEIMEKMPKLRIRRLEQ